MLMSLLSDTEDDADATPEQNAEIRVCGFRIINSINYLHWNETVLCHSYAISAITIAIYWNMSAINVAWSYENTK